MVRGLIDNRKNIPITCKICRKDIYNKQPYSKYCIDCGRIMEAVGDRINSITSPIKKRIEELENKIDILLGVKNV